MRRYFPVIVLFLLSPFIAEVLFGATPASNLASLVVVTPLYGGGAVLIRELARRRGSGWGRIALLGAAYAIVEEGLAIQSIANPNLFNAGLVGGRALGVNWVWSEWTVGYHIVWSIALPILLAELLFPAQRDRPWLGRTGLIVVGVLYLLGALALGAIFRLAVAPGFETPTPIVVAEVLLGILLVTMALMWPKTDTAPSTPKSTANVPAPWSVGMVALVTAAAWFGLLDLPHPLRAGTLVLIPMLLELLLVAGVATLIRRWATPSRAWSALHRLALVLGALPISMLCGFFFVTAANRLDQLVLGVASVITLGLLFFFAQQIQQRNQITLVSG